MRPGRLTGRGLTAIRPAAWSPSGCWRCLPTSRSRSTGRPRRHSGKRPESPAAAFGAAARAGLIDERLAAALALPDGPHHLLVQQYLDAEPERVAGVVSDAVAAYREYVRQVAGEGER